MSWPLSQDYNEAIQSPESSFNDPELKQGEATTNAIGLPMPRSGNFADVYEFNCAATKRKWAIKCFTREVPGLRERYAAISAYLQQVKLPFMVDFNYLDQGIKVRGDWFPILKMHWVEGFTLNEFVNKHADQPAHLDMLCQIWVRLARRLREAQMAHCDLQHGNVLLVPGSTAKSLGVRLIDYDGMCVPALAQQKSGEVGHPAFQHPQRLREGTYSVEVDRFPHLVIYTALRALMRGSRYLWNRYDNNDNLLFREQDLKDPENSALFAELGKLNDSEVGKLVEALRQAARQPLEKTPLLDELATDKTAAPAPPKSKVVVAPAPAAAEPASAEATVAAAKTGKEAAPSPQPAKHPAIKKTSPWVWAGGAAALAAVGLVGFFLTKGKSAQETRPEVAVAADGKLTPDALPTPATKLDPNRDTKPAPKPDQKVPSQPDSKLDPKPDSKVVAVPKPGPADKLLRGLVPRPGALAGIGRWQLETVAPRNSVQSVAWSPNGRLLACATHSGEVRVYDAQTLQLVQLLIGHKVQVNCVAWSPDSKLLASASHDWTVKLWDSEGRAGPILQGHTAGVSTVAWSPDGKQLASGSWDKTVRLWTADGKPGPVFGRHTGGVNAVAWSPDGMHVASAGSDNTVRLSSPDGTPGPVFQGHTTRVSGVAWSPDSKRLASAGEGDHVYLWHVDGTSGPVLKGPKSPVNIVAWSPDGKQLATRSGYDQTVRLWQPDGTPGVVLKGHTGQIVSLAWSPDGKQLVSCGSDQTIRLWQADGKPGGVLKGPAGAILSLAWNPDSYQLASGGKDRSIRLWHVDGTPGPVLKGHGWEGGVLSVSWSPDGKQVASSGGWDHSVRLWAANGTPGRVVKLPQTGVALSVAWSPDGRQLATGDFDQTVQLWDTEGNPGLILKGHTAPVEVVAWSFDGKQLASAGADKTVRLWAANGTPGPLLSGHTARVYAVAWNADGRRLASGGDDRMLHLWQADGEPGPVLKGHTSAIRAVAWSADGLRLVTASNDQTLRLWQADGKPGPVLHGHTGVVRSVAWSTSGRMASASEDGTILLWDADRAEPQEVIVPMQDDRAVTFSAAGQPRYGDPALFEREFVYVIEQADGRLELLKPAQFQARSGAVAKAPTKPEPKPGPKPEAEPKEKRLAVPAATAQAGANKEIKELFKGDYAKKKPTDLMALSGKLLAQAKETKDDSTARYVLYRESSRLAALAGDAEMAVTPLAEVAKEYVVDGLSLKVSALSSAARATHDRDANKVLAEVTLKVVDEALEGDDFKAASQLLVLAGAAAKKAQSAALVSKVTARNKELSALTKLHEKVKGAAETLRQQPDDPGANLVMGKYACFDKGLWIKGLPLLVKGGDGQLMALAEKDLAKPTSGAEQVAVADGWWELADKEPVRPRKDKIRQRAAYWYKLARQTLTGLAQTRIDNRLKSFEEAWIKSVAALPAEEQVEAVAGKLKELNPDFDGKVQEKKIENGVVTEFSFVTDNVTDISPVRALTGLRSLSCAGSAYRKGNVADLSPLRGLKLTRLNCSNNRPIADLSPLKGMQLTYLACNEAQAADLSPLKGMPLTGLNVSNLPVVDLSPLKGMPLTSLHCAGTQATDLSPLKGMPLKSLWCYNMQVTDLSPLAGMSLQELRFTPKKITDGMQVIRQMKTLTTIAISYQSELAFSPAVFWKKHDAGEFNK